MSTVSMGDWLEFVNEPRGGGELEALRRSVNGGCPVGDDDWQAARVEELGLEHTKRNRGRPRKGLAGE